MWYQLNWTLWQRAHLNHEGQSSTEKYVQLKSIPSIGEEMPETASSKTFLSMSMLTDIAKLKSEARAIKETYRLKCYHFDVAFKKITDQNNFS